MLVLCCAIFYWMVNTGQLAIEKSRVLNASDAAAYSAGIVQARGLNYAAYANRAIVANQVSIAQTLSMVSFLNYATSVYSATAAGGGGVNDLSQGLGWAAPTAPEDQHRWDNFAALLGGSLIAQWFGFEPQEFIYYVNDVDLAAGGIITAQNEASVALGVSVAAVLGAHAATLLERSQAVASRVAQEMDPTLHAVVNPIGGVGPIVRRYTDDDRSRLQDVVLRSLDDIVRVRGFTVLSTAPLPFRTGLYRRGGTWMPDLDHWAASDSLWYRGLRWRFGFPRATSTRIAGADATIGSDDTRATFYDRTPSVNADEDIEFETAIYSGMASAYDIDDPASREPTQHRAGISVWVHKNKTDTNTAGHNPAISPAGRLAIFSDAPPVDELSGISRAEILFQRPPRPDGRTEYPNLFNPYWTVRLTTPSAVDYGLYGVAAALRYWH